MRKFTRAAMIVCGAISGFTLSAHFVLLAESPEGYFPDQASIPIVGGLLVGGWSGAFVAWVICRLVWRKALDKAPIVEVGPTGCFATVGGWMLLIVLMGLIGIKVN